MYALRNNKNMFEKVITQKNFGYGLVGILCYGLMSVIAVYLMVNCITYDVNATMLGVTLPISVLLYGIGTAAWNKDLSRQAIVSIIIEIPDKIHQSIY